MSEPPKQQLDDPEDRRHPVVEQEERTLERVLRVIDALPSRRRRINYSADLVELRDSLGEERLEEDRASILEQMERLSRLAWQQAQTIQAESLDRQSPYFGHMQLVDDDGRQRDILVGKNTFVAEGVVIVDWRNAPISRVFYQSEEGDDYELEIAGRTVSGVVQTRRTVTIQRRTLLRVATPTQIWVRGSDGWIEATDGKPKLRGGAGTAARPDRTRPVLGVRGNVPGLGGRRLERVDKHLPEIASLLDGHQFHLITRPDSGLVAIKGTAGSGKTTVALHRVAFLVFRSKKRFAPRHTQIVVGTRALASYVSQVLPALGVRGVPVTTYDDWARRLRRRHYRGFPNHYSEQTPAVVTRFKLHSALLPMLEEGARDHSQLSPRQLFDELLTDRGWLESGLTRFAPGAFSDVEIDQIHRWCTRQHFVRVDGEGATEDEVPCLDVEDDTILLRLYQLTIGPLRASKDKRLTYNHLVVDEVQDLSPIDLAVLLETVESNAPVTLAGDTAQKVTDEGDFQDWFQALRALRREYVKVTPLQISYRSTSEIMAVADAVLGPLASDEPTKATRHGAPVELFRFRGHGEATTFLVDVLRELVEVEPTASVALLTHQPHQAKDIFDSLSRADIPNIRHVPDQDFSFAPGIEVTDVRQTKGLEFDYVILLDCDSQNYPVTPRSRRLLYVGITRAAHQCWLTSVGTPSQLLPDWLVSVA